MKIEFKKILINFYEQGKNSFTVITGAISALFWAYLTFSFIKFMFFYSFGLIDAMNGDYSFALQAIKDNQPLFSTLSFAFVSLYFILNVPLKCLLEIKIKKKRSIFLKSN